LAASTGRVVLWLNPDAVFQGGSIADVVEWMRSHPDVGIVGGRILDSDGGVQRSARSFPSYGAVIGARYSLLTRWFPNNPWSRRFLRTDLTYDAIAPVDWVSGACLLHTRAASDRLDGPDDGFFMYFEDVDFCYRARLAGLQVFYHPGMTVTHRIAGSSRSAPAALLVARHRSLWRWYTKHFRRFWVKDAAVWAGIWIRCGTLVVAQLVRQPRGD
jgi:GT2 family glycosyltransferase